MPQSFSALYCHIIFSTKNRRPFIGAGWKQALFDYIGGIGKANGFPVLAAGGMQDHIHLLVSLGRTFPLPRSCASSSRTARNGSMRR
jgi:REP element-mobilizing transposase RayT